VRRADALEADELGRGPVELAEVPVPERLHALHEALLGARGEQDHAYAAGHALGKRLRERHQHGDGAEVVVRPGHDPPRADVSHRGRRAEREEEPGTPERPNAEQPPERQQERAEEHAEDDRDALARLRVLLREQLHALPRQLGVEHESGVRGVVVRHEDDGAVGVRIACLGHHVPGGPVRQHAPPEPELPAAHVVVDRGSGRRPHRRGRAAPEPGGQG
jgi:hypothetical protein